MKRLAVPACLLAALVSGCHRTPADDSPVIVSVIGKQPRPRDPNTGPLTAGEAVLVASTAQGLVAFDGSGQIDPALAERWTVSDDGLSYLFRLRPATWPNGRAVTTEDVAKRLRAILARSSRNPFKDLLSAVDEIASVTPEVLEIRLTGPRPHLLQLLAQPEMAILRGRAGSGPLQIEPGKAPMLTLVPTPSANDGEGEEPESDPARTVLLGGEPAARAVARFALGHADFVAGGSFADLPLVRSARIAPAQLRIDPARGVFALAFTGDQPFLTHPELRAALSMAINRTALVGAFGLRGWQPAVAIVPPGLPDLPQPMGPGWDRAAIDARQAAARQVVAAWVAEEGQAPLLRVALPDGHGSKLLFARLRVDWARIGVPLVRVGPGDDADLRLIDAVAPADTASWYLDAFSCERTPVCSQEAESSLFLARIAPTLDERIAKLVEADALMAAATPGIVLAMPLRWSLVTPRLSGWRENARVAHPLVDLRESRR